MTDQYAVISNPISHSQSPLIHSEFAKQTGQNIVYDRLSAPLDGFDRVASAFVGQGRQGAEHHPAVQGRRLPPGPPAHLARQRVRR